MNKEMNRDELIILVKKIMNCEGSEKEIDEMTLLLTQTLIDPEVTNYIYFDNLTPEQVVDKALSYKPIQL